MADKSSRLGKLVLPRMVIVVLLRVVRVISAKTTAEKKIDCSTILVGITSSKEIFGGKSGNSGIGEGGRGTRFKGVKDCGVERFKGGDDGSQHGDGNVVVLSDYMQGNTVCFDHFNHSMYRTDLVAFPWGSMHVMENRIRELDESCRNYTLN